MDGGWPPRNLTPPLNRRRRRCKLAAPFSARRSRSSCDGMETAVDGVGWQMGRWPLMKTDWGGIFSFLGNERAFSLLLPNSPKQHSSPQQRAGSLAFSRTSLSLPTQVGSFLFSARGLSAAVIGERLLSVMEREGLPHKLTHADCLALPI